MILSEGEIIDQLGICDEPFFKMKKVFTWFGD